MQVCVDVTCMYIDFGGCGLFGFGDTATLKNGQISLSNHGRKSTLGITVIVHKEFLTSSITHLHKVKLPS